MDLGKECGVRKLIRQENPVDWVFWLNYKIYNDQSVIWMPNQCTFIRDQTPAYAWVTAHSQPGVQKRSRKRFNGSGRAGYQ
jgi:hypothetical protein